MKVVLFCGGLGSRLNAGSPHPKPLVHVGPRPLLWNLMRYYAHFGHTDFILCTGHHAEKIGAYVDALRLEHQTDPCGGSVFEHRPWNVTLVDSGAEANIGERLLRAAPLLAADEYFLANYGDVLSDFPLHLLVDRVMREDAACGLLSVPLAGTFHLLQRTSDSSSFSIVRSRDSGVRMNGGFFVCHRSLLEQVRASEDLVEGALARLSAAGRLLAHEYDGFWRTVDTPKDLSALERLSVAKRPAPWEVWKT